MAAKLDDEATSAVLGLLDLAKVALGPGGPTLSQDEAGELLIRLLSVISRTMPEDLQAQDIRIVRAKMIIDALRQ